MSSDFWPSASDAQGCYYDVACGSHAKVSCFFGGIGSGKTAVGSIVARDMAVHWEAGRRGMIVVPGYQTFHQVTLPEIRKWWPAEGKLWEFHSPSNEPQIDVYGERGHSVVFIRSAQDNRTVEAIRGPTLRWIWGDEVGTWNAGNTAYDLALGRLREQGGNTFPRMFLTGSPRWGWLADRLGISGRLPPQAWTRGTYLSGTRPSNATYIVAAKTESNKNNADGYAEYLRLQYGEAFAAQELDGDFLPPSSSVYPAFYPAIHVIPADVARRLFDACHIRQAGVDWGFRNPCAMVAGGVDGDGRLIVVREFSQSGKTAIDLAQIALRWRDELTLSDWHCDPSDAQSLQFWYGRTRDCPAVPGARPAKNSVEAGLDVVRNLMATSARAPHPCGSHVPGSWLYISAECTGLIDDLKKLQYRPVKEGQDPREDRFVGLDHRPDALRYLAMGALSNVSTRTYR